MPSIEATHPTEGMARALRALNKYGMNLADFACLTTDSSFSGFGNGAGYTVSDWISDGVFANLGSVQLVYPVCQSGTDYVDWVLTQSAVDFLIFGSLGNSVYGSTKRKLFIPAGLFKMSRPIQIGYGSAGTPPGNLNSNKYVSITIEGEGPHYDSSGNGMTGTTLDFDYTNDVGVAVNLGVQVILRGMTIRGGYDYNTDLSVVSSAGVWDVSEWKDPGLAASNWVEGAAVNIGVAIDPYSNATAAAAYPNRVLPAYFGSGTTSAQFSSVGGSDVTLEDVNITQWVVGFGRPHGDSNAEFIRYKRGKISHTVYAVTIGHSQCRNVSFEDVDIFGAHTGFVNNGGITQTGNLHGMYDNVHFSQGFQLFNHDNGGWSGPLKFKNVYVEGAFRIGEINNNVEIDNGFFSFFDQDEDKGSVYNHLSANTATLRNSHFATRNGLFVDYSTRVVLDNVRVAITAPTITGDAAEAIPYMNGVFRRAGPGTGKVISCDILSGVSQTDDFNSDAPPIRTHAGMAKAKYASGYPAVHQDYYGAESLMGGAYAYDVPFIGRRMVQIGELVSRSGYDMTFPRYSWGTLKADVGDVFIVAKNTSNTTPAVFCVVVSISGGNMVLRQLNDYWGTSAGDYQANGREQITTGTQLYADYICTRVRKNPLLVIGSVTDGSAVITNVKSGLESGNAISTSELTMAAGDLFVHQEIETLNTGGSPVSPLNIVSGINTGSQTITLTNNFNMTKDHYPVVFYVKVFNA